MSSGISRAGEDFDAFSCGSTYVTHNEAELLYRQEQAPLLGNGVISLGAPSAIHSDFLLEYSIEAADKKPGV